MSRLWDLGTTGVFEDGSDLVAGFGQETEASAAAHQLIEMDPGVVVRSIEPAPTMADLVGDDPVREVPVGPAGRRSSVVVRLRAGAAFGHGAHPTTRLALDLLADHLHPGGRVLDVGTGTGVLSLAARALGAGAVIGTDIDPDAVTTARANADLDAEAAQSTGDVRFGPWSVNEALDLLGGPPAVVIVNVLLAAHRSLGPAVAEAATAGMVITTGYLHDQVDEVAELYRPLGPAVEHRTLDGWVANAFALGPSQAR